MVYRHGTATYEIHVENPRGATRGVALAMLDGASLHGTPPRFPLVDNGKIHAVRIVLGEGHVTAEAAE
jgi:hypothetical protein